jgi:tetratricopeptide (TPR) repeat protein
VISSSMRVPLIVAPSCTICGDSAPQCGCTATRDSLIARATELRKHGVFAAYSSRLHQALRLLSDAAELGDDDPDAAAVLGLCALALGDTSACALAWERSLVQSPDRNDVARWLNSLRTGIIGEGLGHFNRALAEASCGDWAQADATIKTAVEALPEFIPALRLQGLLAAQGGREAEARRIWLHGLDLCADDPQMLQYLAALQMERTREAARFRHGPARFVWAGTGAVIGAMVAAVTLLSTPAPSPGDPVTVASALARTPTSSAPRAQPPAVESQTLQLGTVSEAGFGISDYRLGRLAVREGAWTAAVHHLHGALRTPPLDYYHDDALYLLAQAYSHSGDPDAARTTAAQLLEQHPSSIYVNSVTRRLATQDAE